MQIRLLREQDSSVPKPSAVFSSESLSEAVMARILRQTHRDKRPPARACGFKSHSGLRTRWRKHPTAPSDLLRFLFEGSENAVTSTKHLNRALVQIQKPALAVLPRFIFEGSESPVTSWYDTARCIGSNPINPGTAILPRSLLRAVISRLLRN